MDGQARRDEQWEAAEDAVANEMAQCRQLAVLVELYIRSVAGEKPLYLRKQSDVVLE
jgi:hypothetical protein